MVILTKTVEFSTSGSGDMVEITDKVQLGITESNMKNGVAVIFCPGSTGAVSTVEYEPGLKKDIPKAMQRLAPYGDDYAHHDTWDDDNGSGHVQATIIGPSLTVPFTDRKLTLGRWQQVVFIECDTRARERKLIVQILGE
ncbi:MAG: secondary thiamine-phosphate synthase enzyme YjbQ [Candidatus Altiarchaeota archaeon]|nr:secondary thiamine-phosphate synthase enzyme YjbQ [Candidatus Altiarchaeota archaeon]